MARAGEPQHGSDASSDADRQEHVSRCVEEIGGEPAAIEPIGRELRRREKPDAHPVEHDVGIGDDIRRGEGGRDIPGGEEAGEPDGAGGARRVDVPDPAHERKPPIRKRAAWDANRWRPPGSLLHPSPPP